MARSLSERVITPPQPAERTMAWPVLGDLRVWPPLLLALLTVVVVMLAYAARPTVRIDLGERYDAVYLQNFHGREVDAAGAGEITAWPADQNVVELPGNRNGVWIATVSAAENVSEVALGEVALEVNDQRVSVVQRRGQGQFIGMIPADLTSAAQLRLRLVPAIVGNPDPPPGMIEQVELAPARTYRWSQDESTLLLPGLGRGAWQVELTTVTTHPDDTPLNAQVFANDTLLATLPESGEVRRARLMVPASLMGSGDLELTLRSNTFEDPRPLGVFVESLIVSPVSDQESALLPPPGALLSSLLLVLSLYLSLALLLPSGGERFARLRPWIMLALPLGLLLLGGWALSAHRFPTSFMVPRLALLGLWSLLLLLVLRPLLAWVFRAAGVPVEAQPQATDREPSSGVQRLWSFVTRPASAFLSLLLLFFFISYWIKVGGMLYPYFVSIDVGWHIGKVRWILQGQLALVYGTNSPLNELTMPLAEWGPDKPVIPYSPFFHMFATSFALLSWPMAFTVNMFSALIDCSRVLIIALLARKGGLSERGALFAGALYGLLPVTFLLHSWGNIPTTFGLWWTLMATAFAVVAWHRLHRPVPFAVLTFFILGSLLFYTVTGVFMGVFVLLFIPIFWLLARRDPAQQHLLGGLRPFSLAALAALGLALLIYYGQYIPPILERTLPYMLNLTTAGPESVGVERPAFGEYMWTYVPHLDYRIWPGDYLYYGLAIPLLFVIPGFMALRKRVLLWSVLAAWFTVSVLFMFAGYRISMVDKQLFYIVPAICICWAVYAERYWMQGRWGKLLVVAVYLFTLASAVDLWIIRIIRSPIL